MPHDPETLELYLAHRSSLVNYASRILGDRAHAEDVVQEAYLRFDSAEESSAPREPLAYLYRIVHNLSLDVRRRVTRDRDRTVPAAAAQLRDIREERPSPEAEAGSRQELRVLEAALAELPERTRTALEMHRFHGHSLREIAAHLGISVGLAHGLVADGIWAGMAAGMGAISIALFVRLRMRMREA